MAIANMTAASTKTRGLGLAVGLGMTLLTVSLYLASSSIDFVRDSRISHWIETQQIFGPHLIGPFVGYGLALLLVHAMFGLLVWLLAVVSEKATNPWGWKRCTHIAVWFAILTFWIVLGNAALFPWSLTGTSVRLLVQPVLGEVTTFDVATGALLLLICICVFRIAAHIQIAARILPRMVLYTLASAVAFSAWHWTRIDAAMNRPLGAMPNIIIIGIDSLRPDFIGAGGHELGYTPELDRFLHDATLFTDATTPLARTFASWMAILTGRAPITTGVRDNLVPRSFSRTSPTLADHLHAAGYRTAYATDEVRFSNIDASYGFDQVIGPRMGIADFILGTFNDMPLPNHLANSWVAKRLFPNTYANRAAAATYRPETFVDWLEDDLDLDEPGFIAVHLTLPHFPFRWADDADGVFASTSDLKYLYSASVVGVDRQFALLMKVLEQRGLLRHAIVVVLSDHGEGLTLPRDNPIYSKAAKTAVGPVRVAMAGHGNSVLSPSQYSVVLAIRGYGPASSLVGPPRHVDVPATLEDVTPTLLELIGSRIPRESFDGESLAHVLRDWPNVAAERYQRVRYTETAFPVDFGAGADQDETDIAAQAIDQFMVDARTGRVVLREENILGLVRAKQRAAIMGDWLLAAIPDPAGNIKFVMVNRRGAGLPRVMNSQLAAADPVAASLWEHLHEHFAADFAPGDRVSDAR